MANFRLFTEDKHGKDFFKKLVHKLKEKGIISREIDCEYGSRFRLCNVKMSQRAIKEAASSFDRVIIHVDADGPKRKGKIRGDMELHLEHVPRNLREKVRLLIIDHEIEEWICVSERLRFGREKLSHVLKRERGYEKRKLPRYAERLNFKILRDYPSFKEFLEFLKT